MAETETKIPGEDVAKAETDPAPPASETMEPVEEGTDKPMTEPLAPLAEVTDQADAEVDKASGEKMAEQEPSAPEVPGGDDNLPQKEEEPATETVEGSTEAVAVVTGGAEEPAGETAEVPVAAAGSELENAPAAELVGDAEKGASSADAQATTSLETGMEALVEAPVDNSVPATIDVVAAVGGNGVEESDAAAALVAPQPLVVAAPGAKQPKRRGRPPKPIPEGALSSAPKRRGRPPKKIEMDVKEGAATEAAAAPVAMEAAGAQPGEAQAPLPSPLPSTVPPRKRGRPLKSEGGKATIDKVRVISKKKPGRKPKEGGPAKVKPPPGSRPRGRPRKNVAAEPAEASVPVTKVPGSHDVSSLGPPKKRGRPKSTGEGGVPSSNTAAPAGIAPLSEKKKRGRPKKEGGVSVAKPRKTAAATKPGKRGRPKKVAGAPSKAKKSEGEAPAVEKVAGTASESKRGRGRPRGATKVAKSRKSLVSGEGKKGRRGRPPTKGKTVQAPAEGDVEGAVSPKRRGRPKKKPKAAVGLLASGRLTAVDGGVILPAKKRGRLPKVGGGGEVVPAPDTPGQGTAAVVGPKKGRGRPPKKDTAEKGGAKVKVSVAVSLPTAKASEALPEKNGGEVLAAGEPSTKKRGRPPTKGKAKEVDVASGTPKEGPGPSKTITAEAAGPPGGPSVPAKKRGRPSMKDSGNGGASGAVAVPTEVVGSSEGQASAVAPKKRGRPRAPIKEEAADQAPKKRGRPALADKDKAPAALPAKAAQKLVGVRVET